VEDQCTEIAEKTATTTPEEEEEQKARKKKMVRFTQQQIDSCIANGEPTLHTEHNRPVLMETSTPDFLAKLPQHLLDALARIDEERKTYTARRTALQAALRKERQDILDQYYAKGYAEYKVDEDYEEDGDDQAAAPRPGRRRFRQGVVKRAGRTRKLN
jgi:shikimate kinase